MTDHSPPPRAEEPTGAHEPSGTHPLSTSASGDDGAYGVDGFFQSIRTMGISRPKDRWIGGVASGLAARLGVDPLLVRGVFIATFFVSGMGLILYGVGWAILPEKSDGRIHLQEAIRGRFNPAMIGAIAMIVFGLGSGDRWGGSWFGWVGGSLWLAAAVAVVWIVVSSSGKRRAQVPPAASAAPDPAPFAADHPSNPGNAGNPTSYPHWHDGSGPSVQDAPVSDEPIMAVAPRRAPKRTRAPGPGSGVVGVVIGLIVLAAAVLAIVARVSTGPAPHVLTWLGVALAVVGAALAVTGLRGRRGGWLNLLAIGALCAALPAAAAWSERGEVGIFTQLDESVYQAATTREQAQQGASITVGTLDFDLRELDLTSASAANPIVVPISVGSGRTTVILPDGAAVQANVSAGAGNVDWNIDGTNEISQGLNWESEFSTQEAEESDPVLVIDVTIGAGTVEFEEE